MMGGGVGLLGSELCVTCPGLDSSASDPTHSGLAGRESSDLPFPPPADRPQTCDRFSESSLSTALNPHPPSLQQKRGFQTQTKIECKSSGAVGNHARNCQELSQHLQP